jgi:chromosomal replication initiator protein
MPILVGFCVSIVGMIGLIQDGPEMVDGVVDIPLSGRISDAALGQGQFTAPSHFFAGPENRLVEVAVRSVLTGPPNGFSPLVLYGPSGTGKSHIAQGIATEWKSRNRHDRVLCTTAVDFARDLADAIETQAVEEFRAAYRDASLLVFEDLGMLATGKSGKLSAQGELVHTLDAVVANDGWVVVTASTAPTDLPDILPALQSRLAAGLTIPIALPGAETRLAIVQQLAELRKLDLPESAARLLAEGLAGTASDLSGALMQLEMPTRIDGGRIDTQAVHACLFSRQGANMISLRDIAAATARHFSIKLSDLRSPMRRRTLVTARGVAVYLARHLTDESLKCIGQYFGGRDHTTVLHSCRKTEMLLESDPTVRKAVAQLRETLWKT